MLKQRNETLQALCRDYLTRLRYIGKKHGIDVDGLISMNRRKECSATRHEVELLSRACNDERISRNDIPKLMGKSYRHCEENGIFDRIKRLRHQGIFSKVSAILLGKELEILNNS